MLSAPTFQEPLAFEICCTEVYNVSEVQYSLLALASAAAAATENNRSSL